MEYNTGVSMVLPDSIGLMENDFDDEDHEDIVHEQTNQNEIVELIMAAFEGHEEPSDDEDDESLNSSASSLRSSDEQPVLNTNNNNNTDEHYAQQQHELLHRNHAHQQALFSTSSISTPSPLVLPTDVRRFGIINNDDIHYTRSQYNEHNTNEEEIPFNTNNHIVHYQNNNHPSGHSPASILQYAPTIEMIDPMQAQFMYQTDTQNQLNKLRILCNVKDRKIFQLENVCEENGEKYKYEIRTLKHKLELTERTKYDWEQRYQMINKQYEESIETNNQSQRTIKDAELRIQQLESIKTQFETKFDDSESLIDSLHRKVNELQQFGSIARSHTDYELVLSTTREKHEQEIHSLNEKLQNIEMNLQEKNVEVDELRVQLEAANKNNEKAIFERMETITHLNEQLHQCERKYTDLLTTNSLESFSQTEFKRQLTRITEDKEKLEYSCQEFQSQIRTLHERLDKTEYEDNFSINHIQDEKIHLKQRIDEFALNEKQLVELNDELKRKIQEYEYQPSRSGSSSSSNSSNETVIKSSTQEKIRNLQKEIEDLRKDYADLEEKYEYEKHELQIMIEQLREDNIDLDKTKQLYIDVCQEKNSLEDKLRSKFEFELKSKIDDLHQSLEKEYNENILYYKNSQEMFEQDKQMLRMKYNQELEQQTREARQDMERIQVKNEKQINDLNNQSDRLRANDDVTNRSIYIEREFEQLKHDYYDLNLKQKELLTTCSTLENENQHLINTLEQIELEKLELKQRFENEEEKLLHEIKQINELNDHQKQELTSIHRQTDRHELNRKQDIESLQIRIDNYENTVSQYEEYRVKLENNLQKISQQRDTNKMDLRLTKEMLTNKEDEFNQHKLHFNECEKHLQNNRERFVQYDAKIIDLERQIKQYEQQNQELTHTRLGRIQEKEIEYREKLISLKAEKAEYDQRLQQANRALNLADSHLQQEIEKIKVSLEQEYTRRYERDQKQHQHDLQQLRKQLTSDFDKQRTVISPMDHQSNPSLQDIEEMKKMYRTEIDRSHRENIELSQHQAKLIDAHQKQMQIMKKELDDGYNNVINEFEHEQKRLQTRYDQLKQQLNDSQQIIEQLKTNLNELKTNHFDDVSKIKETYNFEHENKNNQKDLQGRLEHLVKLLEQSNDALNQERTSHSKQENEYQQTISSLQRKIGDIVKHNTKAVDELKHELHQKRVTIRPTSVPEFVQTDLSVHDMKLKYMATVEKLRGNSPISKKSSPAVQTRESWNNSLYGQSRNVNKKANPK